MFQGVFGEHSMGLWRGNQVDGLLRARHSEAIVKAQGGVGPVTIHTLGPPRLKIGYQNDSTMPKHFRRVSDCVCLVHLFEFQGICFTKWQFIIRIRCSCKSREMMIILDRFQNISDIYQDVSGRVLRTFYGSFAWKQDGRFAPRSAYRRICVVPRTV